MMKFIYLCRKCNEAFPCRKEFTGHNDVYPPENPEYLKQCISPFHQGDHAEFVQVKP